MAYDDEARWSSEAASKRELAASMRRTAALISLRSDREDLLTRAAAIEAEADRVERHGRLR